MKTTVLAIAMILAVSLSSQASRVQSATKNKTENLVSLNSKSSHGTKMISAKKNHSKNHKTGSNQKKTK